MNVLDGRQAVAYHDRLLDTCTHADCDRLGTVTRDGVLTCMTHDAGNLFVLAIR